MHWFIDPIKNQYAVFSGRTSRQAFWMYVLIYVLIYVVIAAVESFIAMSGILTLILSLALFVPSIAITARRLHDTGMSGWWQLLGLIPVVGWIIVIVLLVRPGEAGATKYGPDPKGGVGETPVATPLATPESQPSMSADPETATETTAETNVGEQK